MTVPADTTHTLLLGLAAARITSLLVTDDLLEPLRHRVFSWSPPHDDPELGRWYQSTGPTHREAGFVGRLVGCYQCTAVWCSAATILSVVTLPTVAWPAITIAAVAQLAETAIRISRGH